MENKEMAQLLLVIARELISLPSKSITAEDGYYSLKQGTSIEEVIRKWQEDGDKAYDHSMPIMYKASDLWKYREYTWKRENSRGNSVKKDGEVVFLEGPEKWDFLKEQLKKEGWKESEPLGFTIGQKGGAKVNEGNHRLALAKELNLKVPVSFLFYRNKVSKR